MPSGGQLGSGVKLGYAPASPHVWVTIPQVLGEPTIPAIERDRVDVSVHGTQSLRSYIPGLGDVADLEFEVLANLDVGGVHLALQALERSQASSYFRVEIPVTADLATTTYFAVQMLGRVSRWRPKTPIDGAKTIEIAVQFEGSYQTQEPMATVLI